MEEKIVTFSFDDGVKQDARVMQMLRARGFRGTFNINAGTLGQKQTTRPYEGGPLVAHNKWERSELKEAYDGFEIAAHTYVHPSLLQLDDVGVIEQVVHDYMTLGELAGYPIIGMAYPGAPPNYDDRVKNIISRYTRIRYARGFLSTYGFDLPADFFAWLPTLHMLDGRMDEIIEKFAAKKGGGLLYIWGHSYELDAGDRWRQFEQTLDKIAATEGVTHMTNGEIYARYGEEW